MSMPEANRMQCLQHLHRQWQCTINVPHRSPLLRCNRLVKPGCTAGRHRSPVVAATAREQLVALGYAVAVLEVNLVQPDLIHDMLMLSEDWAAGRAMVMDFANSYSNFMMSSLARDDLQHKFTEIAQRVDELVEERRQSRPRVGEAASASTAGPQPPGAPPSLQAVLEQRGLPVPPAPPSGEHRFSQEDLDLIAAYDLDDGAINSLRRLAAKSVSAMEKVMHKLRVKTDIDRPSQFVTKSCKNATEKLP